MMLLKSRRAIEATFSIRAHRSADTAVFVDELTKRRAQLVDELVAADCGSPEKVGPLQGSIRQLDEIIGLFTTTPTTMK